MMDSKPAIPPASQAASLCRMKNAAKGWQKYYLNMSPETRQNGL